MCAFRFSAESKYRVILSRLGDSEVNRVVVGVRPEAYRSFYRKTTILRDATRKLFKTLDTIYRCNDARGNYVSKGRTKRIKANGAAQVPYVGGPHSLSLFVRPFIYICTRAGRSPHLSRRLRLIYYVTYVSHYTNKEEIDTGVSNL